MSESKCMYCGSTSLGPGCIYGPKGIHVHPNIGAGRCIYCGSFATGPGCVNSPFGNVHVVGIDFNTMIRETCCNGIVEGYLHNRLHNDIKEWQAFKLGLINEKGKIIKKPSSIYEKAALTPIDIYVLRLRNILNDSAKIINNASYLVSESIDHLDATQITELYNAELTSKENIQNDIAQLFESVSKALNSGLSTKKIEQIIIESIFETTNNH